jgi:hypothetical protein
MVPSPLRSRALLAGRGRSLFPAHRLDAEEDLHLVSYHEASPFDDVVPRYLEIVPVDARAGLEAGAVGPVAVGTDPAAAPMRISPRNNPREGLMS